MTARRPEPYQVMPPLDANTEKALRASIERDGVLVPIVLGPDGAVIDGHHRARIATELGVRLPAVILCERNHEAWRELGPTRAARERFRTLEERPRFHEVDDLENADLAAIARELNVTRRHLTVDERRRLVAELRKDGDSLRLIAEKTGVSEGQVRKDIKAEEVRTSTHLAPEKVTGRDGKAQPAKKAKGKAPDRTSLCGSPPPQPPRLPRGASASTRAVRRASAGLAAVAKDLEGVDIDQIPLDEQMIFLDTVRGSLQKVQAWVKVLAADVRGEAVSPSAAQIDPRLPFRRTSEQ